MRVDSDREMDGESAQGLGRVDEAAWEVQNVARAEHWSAGGSAARAATAAGVLRPGLSAEGSRAPARGRPIASTGDLEHEDVVDVVVGGEALGGLGVM